MAGETRKQIDKKQIGSNAWVVTTFGVPSSGRKAVLKDLSRDLAKKRSTARRPENA